jgi:hypothetical protein
MNKPPHKSVGKHARGQVDVAVEHLEKTRISDEDVHRSRKALLYRLQMVVERYGLPERALKLDGLKRALRSRRGQVRRDLLGPKGGALAHSRRLLRQSRARIADLVGRHQEEWKVIGAGIKRVYAQGRRALTDAREKSSPEAFHEWRKQAKYLRYALERLDPLWSGVIDALADQAHKLADYLGDEHDLTVLRETALASRDSFSDEQTLPALLALIERCQAALREKAIYLGSRLYEEKPKTFAARFGQYWKVSCEQRMTASPPSTYKRKPNYALPASNDHGRDAG